MEKKKVFISYKSDEFSEAAWVMNKLEENGVSCWMAPMCITGGASYASEIPAAISACEVFVLILSKSAQESKWVPRELDQAINANKTIMPFMIENCPLKDDFSFYLSNVQRYFAYEDKEGTMIKMLSDIKEILGMLDDPEEVTPAPAEEKKPAEVKKPASAPKKAADKPKKKKNKKALIAAAVSVVAVALVIVLGVTLFSVGKNLLTEETVIFAGEEYPISAYSVSAEGKTITEADIDALQKFEDLNFIDIKNCTVEPKNLSSLCDYDLIRLDFSGTALSDEQLKSIDFEALEVDDLRLSGNKNLKDLSLLAPLSDTLTALSIDDTSVTSIEAVSGFTKLKELSICNLKLSNLNPLSELVYLTKLFADGNNLSSLAGLENTSLLSSVSLCRNNLSDVSALANSAKELMHVRLDDNALATLGSLSACTNIRTLSADNNELNALDFAAGWSNLTSLSAAGNKITVIPSLACGDKLGYLNLSDNQLTAVDGLTMSSSYPNLILTNNNIASITLPEGSDYGSLLLTGNPVNPAFLDGEHYFSKLSLDYN